MLMCISPRKVGIKKLLGTGIKSRIRIQSKSIWISSLAIFFELCKLAPCFA